MKTMKNFGRKLVGLALVVLMVLSVFPMSVFSTFAAEIIQIPELSVTSDTGVKVTLKDADKDGFYDIGNADELYAFAALVNSGNTAINAELTADIIVNKGVMSENTTDARVWKPIGKDCENAYTGTFNGNNKTISGLYLNVSAMDGVGLFETLGNGAEVSNITIENSYFQGHYYVGAFAGFCWGTVRNCVNKATVKGSYYIGGIVGKNSGRIVSCANVAPLTGSYAYVGGISGYNDYYAVFEKCYNTGDINVTSGVSGGISGYNSNFVKIRNCFNTGNIHCTRDWADNLGGIVGFSRTSVIEKCYNTGSFHAKQYVGGIAGSSKEDNIKDCFNIGSVSGTYYVGGIIGKHFNNEFDPTIIEDCFCSKDAFKNGEVKGEGFTTLSAEQFKSGEVAYIMNKGVTDGTQVWYQNIGEDDYPTFSGSTVYKISEAQGVTAYSNENFNYKQYQLTVNTGNYSYAGTDADVWVEITAENGKTLKQNLSDIHQASNAFEKGDKQTFTFWLQECFDKIKSVKFWLEVGSGEGSAHGWHLQSYELKAVEDNKTETVFSQDVYQWLYDDTSYTYTSQGVERERDNYILNVKTGSETNAGTDVDVYAEITFEDGTMHKVNLSDIYPHDDAFEKGQEVKIGFSLPKNDSKIRSIRFRAPQRLISDQWYLESFNLTKTSGKNAGESISRIEANDWIGKKYHTYYK